MKVWLPVIIGFLMAPICVFALLRRWSSIWVLCPHALIVMFVRQWQHGYDSLGTPSYPDLAVAGLYYPILGWFLRRGIKSGRLSTTGTVAGLLHVVAIGIAWGAQAMRDRIWGMG